MSYLAGASWNYPSAERLNQREGPGAGDGEGGAQLVDVAEEGGHAKADGLLVGMTSHQRVFYNPIISLPLHISPEC